MTETIDSANAAASTLFLGQSGEWWDFWLIVAVIFAALAAVAIGITTTGSIVSHKREATGAEAALERFKLETAQKISDSDARTAEANLSLMRLRMPRMLDPKPLKAGLAGITAPSIVDILYVEECSDCFTVASMLGAVLQDMRWPISIGPVKKHSSGPDWLLALPAVLQNRANPIGISVVSRVVGEFNDKSAKSAFARALMQSIPGTNGQWSADEAMPENAIRVVVAPKV